VQHLGDCAPAPLRTPTVPQTERRAEYNELQKQQDGRTYVFSERYAIEIGFPSVCLYICNAREQ